MYKVYINDRLLRIGTAGEKLDADVVLNFSGNESAEKIKTTISAFEENASARSISIVTVNMDATWKSFCDIYIKMEAAGGVVINEDKHLLLIYRNHRWDLPKGKIEKNEEPDVAAIREVNEECGIGKLAIMNQLGATYHTYPFKDQQILKITHWYLMTSTDNGKLKPQLEEGITEVRWMSKSEVRKIIQLSYPSIINLLEESNLI